MKFLFTIAFCLLAFAKNFSQNKDSLKTIQLNEVLVTATRGNLKTPMPFSNKVKAEIETRNLGQDIPILLNFLPSVVTTSDAGNGFGYTGIRVRGVDATRVNVTINGIPYNDSESHGTFFVNMPDFASSLQSIQLQRGAGTSTNGSGAFGASLNMQTENFSEKQNGEISNSIGSFNSFKNTIKYSSGLINKHFEIAGRLSNLHSDGYVDRAKSNLQSYFLQTSYKDKTKLLKFLFFGGKEKTYQSWYGVAADKVQNNPTYNVAGIYADDFGNEKFYDNQTDNYQQHHLQLHYNQTISDNWVANLAFHYTKGKGYYENYETNKKSFDYGLIPLTTVLTTDLINQKWLDNDFYGTTFSIIHKKDKINFIFGGSANKYEGKHFGEVIWAKNAIIVNQNGGYYNNFATKTDATIYSKLNYQVTEKLNLFGDLQYRNVMYINNLVDQKYNFLNPKIGLTRDIEKNKSIYLSYAKANKEPNRSDFESGNPEPESLDDFEFGYRSFNSKTTLNLNVFYMNYKNQLVLTGALDDVGNPIRKNIGKSYRLGVEIDTKIKLSEKFSMESNLTLSDNKNQNLTFEIDGNSKRSDTNISFSPKITAGNIICFEPYKYLKINLLSKFVGSQFMSNTNDDRAIITDYSTQDLAILYSLNTKNKIKTIEFKLMLNNFLDKKYQSNGADYGYGYIYYFPQAGINFMFGTTIKF